MVDAKKMREREQLPVANFGDGVGVRVDVYLAGTSISSLELTSCLQLSWSGRQGLA